MDSANKILALAFVLAFAFASCANANNSCRQKWTADFEETLYSFDKFKEVFRREYTSPREKASKKQLYERRLERVESRWMDYVLGKRSSFLAIN